MIGVQIWVSFRVMTMKFKIIVLFAFVLMLLSTPVYANTVTGRVYDGDGPVDGVSVTAVCDNEKTGTDMTENGGLYAIDIDCPVDSYVTVTATKGDLSGTETGQMYDMDWVIIEIINITLIPEFSMIMIPFLMSLAGFTFLRGKSII